ncbi:hypothetical protein IW261DRAFT_1564389 [Armillaria novae-zelandiae]|uniref:Uncharacterized protein n=1 Tax=Armillaria novae-zelandiae TaxID=153914 RepID=A0AA39P8T9_9AGAR|nr:hypothetical protein IW261DRAFT_1564380 [Armillaria novae-zelandiae]KAK0479721.1 hypothetical protein IW261DRAFT_1564383 [Armillaria novae-zelandiae]KAK0479724.1 hypothetical protein IW261DRAFT_1564386 [Armillaria novae-zelandiae]KAK0479727.1 hypothetical protein IW261DRAFT_1564389 [Armillaria novae-zelandiae]
MCIHGLFATLSHTLVFVVDHLFRIECALFARDSSRPGVDQRTPVFNPMGPVAAD